MDIIEIFKEHLYSIRYDKEKDDEFTRLFNNWNDMEYVATFFSENEKWLLNEIWSDTPDPHSASSKVIYEANELRDMFDALIRNVEHGTKPDLDDHFHYLEGKYKDVLEYIPMKSYGKGSPSFLRMYAIKMDSNCYLITGGGIKLADSIQNSPDLREHVLQNIDKVRRFLRENAILDSEDM